MLVFGCEGGPGATKAGATINDRYNVPDNGKAEIIDGEIVLMSPTGDMPARAGIKVAMSLSLVESKIPGRAYPDNVGYEVNLPIFHHSLSHSRSPAEPER